MGFVAKSTHTELNATAASLLGFLLWGPMSGYELAAEIESSIGNFWNVTRSQIYRELKTLADAGFVDAGEAGLRERRRHAITPAGRAAFDTWLERDPGDSVTRSPVLLLLFFGDRVEPERLARVLREQRARHEARHAEYLRRIPALERDLPYPALTMRFGLMYEEMYLRWLDSLPTFPQTGPGRRSD